MVNHPSVPLVCIYEFYTETMMLFPHRRAYEILVALKISPLGEALTRALRDAILAHSNSRIEKSVKIL